MSLKNLTIKNIVWTYSSVGFSKIIGIINLIILSKLLLPSDFGVVAVASSVTALVSQFSDLGVGTALVQKKERNNEASDSAFIIFILLGFILYIISAILSFFSTDFFNEPRIRTVIWVSSLGFIINSFVLTHRLLLGKDLNFKKITIVDFSVSIIGMIITIILALYNFSYWSLIIGSLIANICEVILIWHINPWRPSLKFNLEVAKELINFSKYLVITNLLIFFLYNVDNITAGKMLGMAVVGIYIFAFKFGNYSNSLIVNVVSRVLFPTFSKIQENREQLKNAYLMVVKYTSIISIPIALGTFAISREFVITVLDEKWLDVIPLLQILSFYGLFRSLSADSIDIFTVIGMPQIRTKILGVVSFITLITIYPATKYFGIMGLSIAMTFSMFLAMIMQIFMVYKIFNLSYISQIKVFTIPIISSIFMFFCIKTTTLLFQNLNIILSNELNLFIIIVIAIISYGLASVILTGGNILKEIQGFIDNY